MAHSIAGAAAIWLITARAGLPRARACNTKYVRRRITVDVPTMMQYRPCGVRCARSVGIRLDRYSGLDRDYDVVEWKLKVERRRFDTLKLNFISSYTKRI